MAILGVLKEHEAHGYELKKRMAELAGGSGGVSFGSLYPALNRLELAGAVRMIDHARPRLVGPMTGAISGELAALRHQRKSATSEPKSGRRDKKRNRKVYGITDKGETRLRELLVNADPSDDRAFHVQVAFCRFLEPSRPARPLRAAAGPPDHRAGQAPSALGHSDHRPLPPLSQGARHQNPDRRPRLAR